MKFVASLLAAVVVAFAGATAAHAAVDGFQVVAEGSAVFPDRTYVITLDRQQRLDSGDVSVLENGTVVQGAVVESASSAAGIGTVLLIDASNSMRGQPVVDAMRAARAFAERNPNQQLGIISFNDRVETLLPLTNDKRAIRAALARTPRNREGTHIYDALADAVRHLRERGIDAGRVVLLSDGQEVGSTVSRSAALRLLGDTHVRVFTVGLKSYAFDAGYLEELSNETGGTYAEASSSDKLAGIYGALGFRLSREYVIRYRSPAGPGEDVEVAIRIGTSEQAIQYTTPETGSAGPYEKSLWDRIVQSWLLVPLVVVVVLSLIVYALASVLQLQGRRRFRSRLGDFVQLEHEERARRRRQEVAELLAAAQARNRRVEWRPLRTLEEELAITDLKIAATTLLLWSVLGALLVALLGGVALGTPVALLGLLVPIAVRLEVKRRAAAVRRLFAEQLPDNLEVMASSLRAGQSLAGSMATVVEDAIAPSRREFRRVVADEQLGVPLDEALEVTATRMQNTDMYQVAIVAMLQREAGGNMAGVLDQVIENVRARMELRRLVRVLTAQARMSRWIISLIPLALIVLIAIISPTYVAPLFNESGGQLALVVAGVCVLVGFFVINRIASLNV